MNTEKFTPGPWERTSNYKVQAKCNSNLVASTMEAAIPEMYGPDNECEANTNLIAAAPDMYEALNMCLREFQLAEWDGQICDIIKSALSKANQNKTQ